MAEIDRTALIEQLDALLDEDDAKALAAAREAGRIVSSAGLSWDDVLFPVAANDTVDDDDTGPKVDLSELPDDESGQIEMLLARTDLNDDTRDDLQTFKQDIANGSLADEDRRYLRALIERIGKS
ncbi:MAG: hypothetical protein RIM72_23435 [Alphaproteobacteria bacterium]